MYNLFRLSLVLFLAGVGSPVYAQNFYRYVNDDGVKVLNHSIPPEYAQKGYEVINASGKIIKVVPPAPSAEEQAQFALEQEIIREYERLKHRYSSPEDIESTKQRRLRSIESNISVLKGNINGLTSQVEKIMSDAARFERRNQQVPEHILKQLDDANAEIKVAEGLLEMRKQDMKDTADKYDEEIARFIEGEKLMEQKSDRQTLDDQQQ